MKLETSKVWRRWDLQENCSNSSMVGLLEINDCLRKLIWRAEGINHCFTVKNSIGKRPISPLTASLVDFWLIPSKYLHKYRFNFGRTWCLSVLFKEQLFVHFDLLSKNGLQTSIAYFKFKFKMFFIASITRRYRITKACEKSKTWQMRCNASKWTTHSYIVADSTLAVEHEFIYSRASP